MKNYKIANVDIEKSTGLYDLLDLTGADVRINHLPEKTGVTNKHSHQKNEEIYIILSGKGKVVIDEEEIDLKPGSVLKISAPAVRQFFAAEDTPLNFISIEVKEDSLEECGMKDAILIDSECSTKKAD